MQALSDSLPTVLAPKTIDNDLGLNYRHEPDEWAARAESGAARLSLHARARSRTRSTWSRWSTTSLRAYATAVFVSAWGVQRIRTTAESHRRIAIIEVMGRHSGYLALGTAYGQPDIVLIPEVSAQRRPPGRARHGDLRAAKERGHRLRRRGRR